MKQLAAVSVITLFLAPLALATTPILVHATDFSDELVAATRQSCSSTQASLRRLQVLDSNQRAYLGNTFETAIQSFFTPLNLRLVRNGISAPELVSSFPVFASAKTDFSARYVTYARAMDTLLRIDCASNPEAFLEQLAILRNDRNRLRDSVQRLTELIDYHRDDVRKLQESL
jgi:hypothetical protein